MEWLSDLDSHSSIKFGGNWHSGSRKIMVFACHVILKDYVIKALYNVMVRNSLQYFTILRRVVDIGTVVLEI